MPRRPATKECPRCGRDRVQRPHKQSGSLQWHCARCQSDRRAFGAAVGKAEAAHRDTVLAAYAELDRQPPAWRQAELRGLIARLVAAYDRLTQEADTGFRDRYLAEYATMKGRGTTSTTAAPPT